MLKRILGPAMVAGLLAGLAIVQIPDPPQASARPADAEPQTDLALVPADAVGFVHVRLADIWKNDLFANLRKTWERAGEKAVAALDAQFVPSPTSIDRATAFVLLDDPAKGPQMFGILTYSKPFEPELLVKSYFPKAKAEKVGNRTIHVDEQYGLELAFPDNRHVLIGQPGTLAGYFARKNPAEGPMSRAIKLAATRPLVAAANIAALPIPPQALEEVPAAIRPLLKAEHVMIALEFGAEAKLEVKAGYKDAAAAGDAQTAFKALTELGRKELAKARKEMEDKLYDPNIKSPRPAGDLPEAIGSVFAIGALGRIDDVLADPKLVALDGKDLAFSTSLPKESVAAVSVFGPVALGLLLPAIQKVREAASRSASSNNLKQIGLAIHNYESVNGTLPQDITDKNGKPLLSWRVAILPYIEQENLYKKFKLDEPWDSEANKPWSQMLIKTYLSPSATVTRDKDEFGLTSYLGVTGPDTAFEAGKKLKFTDFTDGLSNTIFVVESAEGMPWAKPGGLAVDPKKPLPKFEMPGRPGLSTVLLGDGSVRTVNMKAISEKTLRAAFTRSGGEVLGSDW